MSALNLLLLHNLLQDQSVTIYYGPNEKYDSCTFKFETDEIKDGTYLKVEGVVNYTIEPKEEDIGFNGAITGYIDDQSEVKLYTNGVEIYLSSSEIKYVLDNLELEFEAL